MYTDVVGYTGMMQQDEPGTLLRLDRHRTALSQTVSQYGGRIIQYFGDGSLTLFNSAYHAAMCGTAIQQEAKKDGIPLRIGIHLGEVIFRDGTAFGDGLNVASRIETLGMPGSVLISGSLYEQIRNQPHIRVKYLGKFRLRNVSFPAEVFSLLSNGLPEIAKKNIRSRVRTARRQPLLQRNRRMIFISLGMILLFGLLIFSRRYIEPADPPIEDKSIAVLPFRNLSGNPGQNYFSEGITEDIQNELSKIGGLKVKSRITSFNFNNGGLSIQDIGKELSVSTVLEGSVRKSGNRVRIFARLIDARSGIQVWSDTFDRQVTEILKIQSEIAIEIADALKARLTQRERDNIIRQGTTDINAYNDVLKARNIWKGWNNEDDLNSILSLLNDAIHTDPHFAYAYAMTGKVLYEGMRNYGVPASDWINKALSMAEKAIRLDSASCDAYLLRSDILYFQLKRKDAAYRDLLKAYQLDPGNPDVLFKLGNYLFREGDYDHAALMMIRSIDFGLTDKDPEYYIRWGDLYHFAGDDAGADSLYNRALETDPGWSAPQGRLGHLFLDQENYSQAVSSFQGALDISPNDEDNIDGIAWAYFLQGDYVNAVKYWGMYKSLENRFPDPSQYVPFRHRLAYIQWLMGHNQDAFALMYEENRLDTETRQGLRNYSLKQSEQYYYDLAAVNSFVGNSREAIAWLDSASEKNATPLWLLEHDPLLKNIRNQDPFIVIERKEKKKEAGIHKAFRKAINEYNGEDVPYI